jgi:hypothetical protein
MSNDTCRVWLPNHSSQGLMVKVLAILITYLLRPRRNSVFCGPETAVVARGEAEGNNGGRARATKHTVFPRSQYK